MIDIPYEKIDQETLTVGKYRLIELLLTPYTFIKPLRRINYAKTRTPKN